jgi:RHS repeat-associated protein
MTGRPGFTHSFDAVNRLWQSQGSGGNPERYHYDGHGRRTATFRADGSVKVDYYTRDGVLRATADTGMGSTGGSAFYVHLGETLVAQDAWAWRSPFGMTYFHVDHQGTPIARSDAWGMVFERTRRQSFGQPLVGPLRNGPGYTGHMEDPGTGLVYMQQRYYDPAIARFLSVDPVGPLEDASNHFGRYHYALNNPYRFTDPDGRLPILIPVAVVAWRAYSAYDTVTSAAGNISTLADAGASTGDKLAAGAELAGSLIGGKVGRNVAGGAARMGSEAADSARNAQVIYRRGDSAETATRLERKATEAQNSNIGIHGVSGSTTKPDGPCSSATCGQLEAAGFKVHDTPTRADPNHKTIELPSPVTREDAQRFNSAFGREKK